MFILKKKIITETTTKALKLPNMQGALHTSTVVPTKGDNDVILCLELLSKTQTYALHLSLCESIDHLCINPISRIGLIHEGSIYYKSLITL